MTHDDNMRRITNILLHHSSQNSLFSFIEFETPKAANLLVSSNSYLYKISKFYVITTIVQQKSNSSGNDFLKVPKTKSYNMLMLIFLQKEIADFYDAQQEC